MTKRFLLPSLLILVSFFSAQGQQCTPDTTLPDSIAISPLPYSIENPERGIQDTACVGHYFETILQINLPETIMALGQELTLVDATIPVEGGIINLPSSLDYICNPPNCVFNPDTVGCLIIYGTAEEGEIGEYDLKISTTLNIGIDYNTTLPDDNLAPGNYYLYVQDVESSYCQATALSNVVENGFDLRIQPNPLSDFAEIFVNLSQADEYTFTVYNTLGTVVQQQKMNLQKGENYVHFDGSSLAVGMYVFVLHNETKASSGRLLIQR